MSTEFPVDPSSPLFVAQAVLAAAVGGGATGATLGFARRQNPFQLGVNMSINCGIASLAFFGTREYLVSPILLGLRRTAGHARRADALRGQTAEASLGDVRTERLLDSAISGALSAGALSLFVRGPRTAIPAAFTAALIATAAQASVNQARVLRLQLLAKRARESTAAELLPPVPLAFPAEAPVETLKAFEEPLKPAGERRGDAPLTGRIMSALSSVLPVKRLTDQEYLDTLERKRVEVQKRLGEIDREQLEMWEGLEGRV